MRARALATAGALGCFAAGSVTAAVAATETAEELEVREVFSFADERITESSGLVVRDGLFVTTNDSGDDARLYTVDESGETVGTTTYADEVVDVEALAPAADPEGGEVWVGDIGANTGARDSVTVYRVPVGPGDVQVDAPSYELVYPGGRTPDAESLLVNPRTGRLLVITKEVFGGTLYQAPAELDEDGPNRLREVDRRQLTGVATDAAFLPDGRHIVVRNYERADFFSFPELETVGEIDLPEQPQGEAIAVAEDGRVHISTEGPSTPVLWIVLPESLREELEAVPTDAPTGPEIREVPDDFEIPEPDQPAFGPGRGNWLVGGLLGLGVLVVLIRALRPR